MDEAHVAEVNVRNKELKPPSLLLLALEGRAPWEFGASLMTFPLLKNGPRGDGHSKANNVWRLYQAVSGKTTIDDVQIAEIRKLPPVPVTSIFSRSDGIVSCIVVSSKRPIRPKISKYMAATPAWSLIRSFCMRLPIGSRTMKEIGSALIDTAIMV